MRLGSRRPRWPQKKDFLSAPFLFYFKQANTAIAKREVVFLFAFPRSQKRRQRYLHDDSTASSWLETDGCLNASFWERTRNDNDNDNYNDNDNDNNNDNDNDNYSD